MVVTRPRSKAGGMMAALRRRGAQVILAPSVRIAPPERPEPFLRALTRLDGFDWVVLTSASALEAVRWARDADGGAAPFPARPRRLAVVGPSTAKAAAELGWSVDLMPDEYTGEALLEALEREVRPLGGSTMLLPLAEAARDVLPEGLRARGARVTRVTAYRTVPAGPEQHAELRRALDRGAVDLLTFTSPSTAERLLEGVGPDVLSVPAAVIGPVTARAARALGFRIAAVAEEHTVQGLVSAAERALGGPADAS